MRRFGMYFAVLTDGQMEHPAILGEERRTADDERRRRRSTSRKRLRLVGSLAHKSNVIEIASWRKCFVLKNTL